MINRLIDFFGHFHPVWVHLPIGFLLLAVVLQWMMKKEKYAQILPAVRIAFLLGMISAVFSCLTGLSLASGGEYDETTLDFHRWLGISVAFISAIGYWLSAKPPSTLQRILSALTLVLIILTGHLGGTLTHGEGYLMKGFSKTADSSKSAKKIITNVQEAIVYADIIQPLLTDKCGGCHSAIKQKGGLRLDGKDWILKGGKDGKVFITGNASRSELFKRVVLDPLEEKHMPPKGKRQLTEKEIILLHWWIESDGGFEKKVREINQTPQVTPALLALQSADAVKKSAIPAGKVEKISQPLLDSLLKAGVTVLPVALNSNYLQASFITIPKPGDKEVGLLQLISKQLVWLKMPGAVLSPATWKIVGNCTNLTRLSMEHSNISDATISSVSALSQLQYLNLVGTQVSANGMQQLKNMQLLDNLYLGQTLLKAADIAAIQKWFPKTIIDSGNYHVENLALDTQLLKPPPVKK